MMPCCYIVNSSEIPLPDRTMMPGTEFELFINFHEINNIRVSVLLEDPVGIFADYQVEYTADVRNNGTSG